MVLVLSYSLHLQTGWRLLLLKHRRNENRTLHIVGKTFLACYVRFLTCPPPNPSTSKSENNDSEIMLLFKKWTSKVVPIQPAAQQFELSCYPPRLKQVLTRLF
jgi:hypothetical protein